MNPTKCYQRVQRSEEERAAIYAAVTACQQLAATLEAYKKAGLGSHVTSPIQCALDNVQYSISEVRS